MASRSEQLKRTEHRQDIEFGTPIPHRNTNKYGYGNAKQYESGNGDSFKKNGNRIAYGDMDYTHGYKQGQDCENRLPVNLFYSAAQYNRMLITNGKSVKKKSEPHIEGYMGNLEFINDPIFQSCQQRRQSLRHKIKPANNSERKQGNSTQDCNCCCCDQFCRLCAKQHSKGQNHNHHKPQCKTKKITEYELQKALQKVNSKNLKPKKKNRIKVITSEANIKSATYDKSKQKNRTQKQKQKQKQKGISNSQKQGSSSYLSHKSFNIQNLVYKSLMQFEEEKRQSQLKKILERQMRYEKDVLMKKFDEQIRMRNRESLSKQKPKSRNKSLKQDKNTIRFEYWQAIRQKISKSLQKPISPPKKYPSTPPCHHKTTLTPQMIQTLKMKYQKQAKQRIQKQTRKKAQKKKKIEKQLKELDRYRKKHVRSCGKKKFEPTEEMIEGAFKGIGQDGGKRGLGGREIGKDGQGKDGRGMRKNKGI